ncbi:hypothetical protein SCA05_19860 [Staphylococcus carnosus]|nr:hypothetical protein SCA05_19860 [Staphylococcus carnosus]
MSVASAFKFGVTSVAETPSADKDCNNLCIFIDLRIYGLRISSYLYYNDLLIKSHHTMDLIFMIHTILNDNYEN